MAGFLLDASPQVSIDGTTPLVRFNPACLPMGNSAIYLAKTANNVVRSILPKIQNIA